MGTRTTRRGRALRTAGLALAPLLGAACLAPAPERSVRTEVGVVRAETRRSAEYHGALLADLHPKVRSILPGALDRSTELWVQEVLRRRLDEEQRPDAMGFTLLSRDLTPGRIHLREHSPYPEWYLAHELGHALMGPTWDTLPGVLSEGVCDWIAAEVNPHLRATIRTHRLLHATLFFGGMSYDVEYDHPDSGEPRRTRVWYEYDGAPLESPGDVLVLDRWTFHSQEAVPVSHYGLGYVVVTRIAERHGLERLHELCLDAEAAGHDVVPAPWILDAAGIDGPDGWRPATNRLLGRSELMHVVRLLPAVFRELPVIAFQDRFPGLDGERFLERADPRVHLADGSVVRLADIGPARDGLVALRPASAPRR